MPLLTPELIGSALAALIPSASYCWRVWLARRERAEQRAAILQCAANPQALAALAKLDALPPDLKGPTALLLIAAAAGTLAANATIAAPIMGVELPSHALGAELPARCSPQDCRPPAYCANGHCEAAAKPPEAPSPEPAAPPPSAPAGGGRGAAPRSRDDEEAMGPRSGYARVPWAETLPGRWSPFLYEDQAP